jgi:putative transposase
LSTGEKINVNVPVSETTKNRQRRIKNKIKGSHNRYKHQVKINKSIEHDTNRRKDAKNKIVSYITNKFETVVVQDENIKGWHSGLFGKQIQASAIGGIMSDLKRKSHTLVVVDRFFPSTKLCPVCGIRNNISLSEREYVCQCGYYRDRDTHSANNILNEGLRKIGVERTEFTLSETSSAAATPGNSATVCVR